FAGERSPEGRRYQAGCLSRRRRRRSVGAGPRSANCLLAANDPRRHPHRRRRLARLNPMNPPRTYVACLTPPGRAAIATLAVRGPDAWRWLRELFPTPLPDVPELGTIHLGRIGIADAQDAVVLSVREAAPLAWLELHCHGGPEVVRQLTELFV